MSLPFKGKIIDVRAGLVQSGKREIMTRVVCHKAKDLDRYLTRHGEPRYALSYWPEAPPQGELLLVSDSLRELLRYAIQFKQTGVRIIQKKGWSGFGWSVENLDYPPEVVGDTQVEADECFWRGIEQQVREGGRECQLFERGGDGRSSLPAFLDDWLFAEKMRRASLGAAPPSKVDLLLARQTAGSRAKVVSLFGD